jgi:hypothetical protein
MEMISLLTFADRLSFNVMPRFDSGLCFLLQVKETSYLWWITLQ